MFKVDKKVEYALIVLKHLVECPAGARVSARDICDAFQTPFDATSRVMQIMAQKGWLKSVRGANGGYCLTSDLHDVTLMDMLELIVGPVQIANCLNSRLSECQIASGCNVIGPVRMLNDKVMDFYRNITVRELVDTNNNYNPAAEAGEGTMFMRSNT